MTFSGTTVVVTGGTGALGSVCVRHFSEAGLNIAVPHSSKGSPANLPHHLPVDSTRFFAAVADLTKEDQVESFVDEVLRRYGTLDYLVNAAGGYAGGRNIDEVTLDEWEGIMKLNLQTAFLMCRAALRTMRKQNFGRIVNIAAMPALIPTVKKGPYAVSKRAVVTLTETIAEEVKGTRITANAVAPGTIRTEANMLSMPNADFSKWVRPEEIAELVLTLCSDEAESMSGNVIKISR